MNEHDKSGDGTTNPDQPSQSSKQKMFPKPIEGVSDQEATASEKHDINHHRKPVIGIRLWRTLVRPRKWRNVSHVNWVEKATLIVAILVFAATAKQVLIYSRQAQLMQDSVGQTERAVILNMGQLAVANRNAKTAEGANEISRQSLDSVQRAFVIFDGNKFDDDTSRDLKGVQYEFLDFTATWENGGTTSAMVAGHMYEIEPLTSEPSEAQFKVGVTIKWQQVSRYIGPHGTYLIGPYIIPKSWVVDYTPSPFDKTHATPTGKRLYFWGWMVYRDVFKDSAPHVTEFCRLTNRHGAEDPKGLKTHIDFGFCKEHNCADEQCKDYKEVTALAGQ